MTHLPVKAQRARRWWRAVAEYRARRRHFFRRRGGAGHLLRHEGMVTGRCGGDGCRTSRVGFRHWDIERLAGAPAGQYLGADDHTGGRAKPGSCQAKVMASRRTATTATMPMRKGQGRLRRIGLQDGVGANPGDGGGCVDIAAQVAAALRRSIDRESRHPRLRRACRW